MRQLTVLVCITAILLYSCSRERSFEGNGASSKDSLLARMVMQYGTDSSVYSYGYDGSRRLSSQDYVETNQGGSAYHEQVTLRRNSQGTILQIIQKSDSLKANGLDSLVYNVNYDGSRYTYQLATFSVSGITLNDSIAYSYDGSGKVVKAERFLGSNLNGGYSEFTKTEYAYTGSGNISDTKLYIFNSNTGVYTLVSDDTYEYDANVNPLNIGVESILIEDPTLFSGNNVSKVTTTDYTDPSNTNSEALSFVYTYNTQKKPDNAVGTYQSGGSFPVFYYYQ